MRNAFNGYTYQKHVTSLLLSIMDVERNIVRLDIEAKTGDDFDDLVLTTNSNSFQLQIKDFENVSIDNIKLGDDEIFIRERAHRLSNNHNIIFFKEIELIPNDSFLDFPCYRLSESVSLVSLSRAEIDQKINHLYENNPQRKNQIDSFFSSILDKREWEIPIESLPQIKIFITELQEKSVQISHELLEFENLLLVEGKPGIGKSHFVNTLTKEYENNVVYRFWIGNQDKDYEDRLKFGNFIRDLNAKLFHDQKERATGELLNKLKQDNKTFIIDGLDHIENYNKPDFDNFVKFINEARDYCKIIVLSRPLVNTPDWKKHTLTNWNLKQTQKVLNALYHLSEYLIVDKIYELSKGYPIIVKYLAEHYKVHRKIPAIESVDNTESYYQKIIANEKGMHSLSLFLCCNSYIMRSEIGLFIGAEKDYVDEFIKEHPYLFDIKLNRISLFHDSFNTFLRKQVNYQSKASKVAGVVYKSVLNLEKRFLSRVNHFQLSAEHKLQILIKYASIDTFERVLKNTIDFEALRGFYNQVREMLFEFSPEELGVANYYDLSLIFNIVIREHLSTINTFYYTYVQSLIDNGITDDDITSSDYLFGMYYYVKTKNAALLLNRTADDHYDIEYFYRQLDRDVNREEMHIVKHHRKLGKAAIDRALKDKINFRDHIIYIIENIFIHKSAIKGYEFLKSSFEVYLKGNNYESMDKLKQFLRKYDVPDYYSSSILSTAVSNLLSYGYRIDSCENEYQDLTLEELVHRHRNLGSFDLRDKIHNYIRLARYENRRIDINSIYLYWPKYYQRKDYTLYALAIALKTLQSEKLVSLESCIALINQVQEVSEKGYRHLLAEFIEMYPPSKMMPFIEHNFDAEYLRVDWFKLPTKYINKLSDRTYQIEENELMRYHSRNVVPIEEIENVLSSNKSGRLESTLGLFKTKISFKKEQNKLISKFNHSKLRFEEQTEDGKNYKDKENSQERFEKGILSYRDRDFIKKMNLKPDEIAKCADGNYTSLSEIELFKIYTPTEINRSFKGILYNSINNKTKSINFFYSLYYHPGNVLAMIKLYRNKNEFNDAVKSFSKFLSLSMFELN